MKAFPLSTYLTALILVGCSVDGIEPQPGSVGEIDLYVASQVMGESLSEQSDGVISSLIDAFEIPSAEQSAFKNETDYSYQYDDETGKHLVSFVRESSEEGFEKSMSTELSYIFYDADGGFIDHPALYRDAIVAMDFSGRRDGSISNYADGASVIHSTFIRTDSYRVDGLAGDAPSISIEGKHEGQGVIKGIDQDNKTYDSNYSVKMNLLNLQVDKTHLVMQNSFDRGITGGLAYDLLPDQDQRDANLNGVVELAGDGTALLKFKDYSEIFTIKLSEAKVLADDEFEGHIRSINVPAGFIVLTNSQRVWINSGTEIVHSGDLSTLRQVSDALKAGHKIFAAGKFIRRGNSDHVIGTEVMFWQEND